MAPRRPIGYPGAMIRIRLRVLLLAAVAVAGCASAAQLLPGSLPPIATGEARLPGKIVWRDLVTPDLAAARTFYGGVLGWEFDTITDGYVMVRNGDRLVGGMAQLSAASDGSQWLPHIAVADVEQSAEAVRRSGGKILLGPLSVPGRGEVVVARDPQGAIFGMMHTAAGDPPDLPPRHGDWLWSELWTADRKAAAAFYFPLFMYAPGQQELDGTRYLYFKSGGKARAGMVEKPDPTVGNAWVSYVRVADVAAVVARAPRFGGRVLFAPSPEVRRGSIAMLADPGGAGVLVQEWPMRGAS
jgi:hypothetical protein